MDKQFTDIAAREWQMLKTHHDESNDLSLSQLLKDDPQRFKHFSLSDAHVLYDFSRNHCSQKTIQLLCELATASGLPQAIEDMFAGKCVNSSENQAALHTALRNSTGAAIEVNGADIMPEVRATLLKVEQFAKRIRSQKYLGYSGLPVNTIVNIGIGGSDLGPKMAQYALAQYQDPAIAIHYVSNLDNDHIKRTLKQCDPGRTLFITSSKSFTTLESHENLQYAKAWMRENARDENVDAHFVAVTASPQKAEQLGFQPENIFSFWQWVGGRYSIWSAVSLSLVIAIGMAKFKEFLAGAEAMDKHFQTQPFASNIPVIMALLGIWYNNFYGYKTRAVIPYHQGFLYLPDYLQQLYMESLGKTVRDDMHSHDRSTGYILWGGMGTNSQHSFHQLLFQGSHQIPIDFILPIKVKDPQNNHEKMLASALAQSDVLTYGDPTAASMDQFIKGNSGHNLLFTEDDSPRSLGALIALYEHKVYTQSVIWQINAFDQWGVQLGKKITGDVLQRLRDNQEQGDTLIKLLAGKIYD